MPDKLGRPMTKTCECGVVLGRTARLCLGCGHAFIGKNAKARNEPSQRPSEMAPVDDFDCEATPEGGLEIRLHGDSFVLTPAQRCIVAIELRLAGA